MTTTPPDKEVRLTENEALEIQWKLILDWPSFADTWALKHSATLSGLCIGFVGTNINNFYRKKTKLGHIGHWATHLPVAVVPTLLLIVLHKKFISSDIILEKTKCTVCNQVKTMALHSAIVTYPMILSPLSCYMVASYYNTVRMPALYTEPKKLLKYHWNNTKPLFGRIPYYVIACVLPALILTYFEYENYYTIMHKLQIEEEEELEKIRIDKNGLANK